jgi:hypothetical protein
MVPLLFLFFNDFGVFWSSDGLYLVRIFPEDAFR